jgi:hypothetical protein
VLEGFERSRLADPAAEGRCRATAPPPAGHPQTHVMWHAPMPALSRRFTVVAADPPGYGRCVPARSGSKRDMPDGCSR